MERTAAIEFKHCLTSGVVRVVVSLSLMALGSCLVRAGEQKTIAIIDTYGLHNVSREAVLAAAGIRVGDAVPDSKQIKNLVQKLEAIPGVDLAAATVIQAQPLKAPPGTPEVALSIIYIGVRETGRPPVSFRPAPTSSVLLPDEIVETHREFERTMRESARRGYFAEDDSNGYTLFGDDATRAVQKRFVPLAAEHYDRLIEVLQTAKSDKHRAIAAWVVGYASDKKRASAELAKATRDPDSTVRNDAMRALGVILDYAKTHRELVVEAPIDWYLDLLESLAWTDRNKTMFVLLGLTADRDDAILAKLRQRSLAPLVEMTRWSYQGHAMMACILLGRVARMTEPEILSARTKGVREAVIARALQSVSKKDADSK